MTDPVSRLGEIKARLARITPGDWEVARGWDIDDEQRPMRYVRFSSNSDSTIMERDEDAEFIASAPVDVGWLLEHIEQQRMERHARDEAYRLCHQQHEDLRAQRQSAINEIEAAIASGQQGAGIGYALAAIRAALEADDDR